MPTQRPLTIKINGTDRTANVPAESIRIEDTLGERGTTASFTIEDGGSFGLDELQAVLLLDANDANVRWFAGYLENLVITERGPILDYDVHCIDYSFDLDHPEALVDATYTNQSDRAIIQAFMASTNPGVGLADVAEVKSSIPNIEFDNVTPRAALEELAAISGARFYIDYNNNLHYFKREDSSPFVLTDSPTAAVSAAAAARFGTGRLGATRYGGSDQNFIGYGGLHEATRAAQATRVVVVGRDVTATRSAAQIGGRHLVTKLTDRDITTTADAETRGDQFLLLASPGRSFTLTIREPGIRAGEYIRLINSTRAIDDYFLVRRVTTASLRGSYVQASIELGDPEPRLESRVDRLERLISDGVPPFVSGGAGGGGGGGGFAGGGDAALDRFLEEHLPEGGHRAAITLAKASSITLNADETGTPSQNAQIIVERGLDDDQVIRWDEAAGAWRFLDGTVVRMEFYPSAGALQVDSLGTNTINFYQDPINQTNQAGSLSWFSTYLQLAAVSGYHLRLGGSTVNEVQVRLGDNSGLREFQILKNNLTKVLSVNSNGIVDFLATMGNSTKDPATQAPDDWVEIKIGGSTFYLPAYVA